MEDASTGPELGSGKELSPAWNRCSMAFVDTEPGAVAGNRYHSNTVLFKLKRYGKKTPLPHGIYQAPKAGKSEGKVMACWNVHTAQIEIQRSLCVVRNIEFFCRARRRSSMVSHRRAQTPGSRSSFLTPAYAIIVPHHTLSSRHSAVYTPLRCTSAPPLRNCTLSLRTNTCSARLRLCSE